jgi:putative addiction module antidote
MNAFAARLPPITDRPLATSLAGRRPSASLIYPARTICPDARTARTESSRPWRRGTNDAVVDLPCNGRVVYLLCKYKVSREVTMGRKIFRTGNSAVVSIPPEALEAVGLQLGDEVSVTVDPENARIVLTPATLPGVRPGFLDRVDRFIDRYQPALQTLAEE